MLINKLKYRIKKFKNFCFLNILSDIVLREILENYNVYFLDLGNIWIFNVCYICILFIVIVKKVFIKMIYCK